MWIGIALIVVLLAALVVFFMARRIAGDNDNLMLGIRIGAIAVVIMCVIIGVIFGPELFDYDISDWFRES